MPDLVFRSLDRCDVCGRQLPVKDRLAGLCESCEAILPPVSPEPEPAERRRGSRRKGHGLEREKTSEDGKGEAA